MLKNLSIRTCLTLMILFFGVVLLFGAAAGLLSLRSSNASLQQMYTVDTPAVADLEGSAGQLLRLRLALATYASLVDLNDQDGANAVLKRFDQYQKASNDRLAHYVSRASADADEQRLIKDMQDKRDTFLHEGVDPALAALKSGDKTTFQQLQAHKLPSLYSAYEKAMLALEQLQLDHGAQRYQDAQDLFYAICIAVAIGIVASLLGAWIGRAVLVRAIVRPVDATIAQFQRIANGDLTGQIVVASNNEMGRLAAALRKMQESLITTVNSVRQGTESIDTGVSEIAAGNTDLSQRTEEQAASLEETAASIEQLTSTVKQNGGQREAGQLARAGRIHACGTRRRSDGAGGGHDAWHRRRLAADCRHCRRDRRHRVSDQYSGAERGSRSRARRRAGPRFRSGGERSALARATQRGSGQGDQGLDRRVDRAGAGRLATGSTLGLDNDRDRRTRLRV